MKLTTYLVLVFLLLSSCIKEYNNSEDKTQLAYKEITVNNYKVESFIKIENIKDLTSILSEKTLIDYKKNQGDTIIKNKKYTYSLVSNNEIKTSFNSIEYILKFKNKKPDGKIVLLYPDSYRIATIQKGDTISYKSKYFNEITEFNIKYEKGKKEGDIIVYDNKRKIKRKFLYKKGILNKVSNLYPSGQVKSILNFKNNKKEGLCTGYYTNKKRRFQVYFKKGVLDGEINYFHKEKFYLFQGTIKDGLKDGKFNFYNEEAKKIGQLIYKENELKTPLNKKLEDKLLKLMKQIEKELQL